MDLEASTNLEDYFWLSTTFQNTIQVSLQLSNNPAPEQTPYCYKYQAISKLKSLLDSYHSYHFIVHTILGEIYSDVDQLSDSVRSYEKALLSISQLPEQMIPKFYNNLLVLYNMLAISYINREMNTQGLGCLGKAMQLYQKASKLKEVDVYHNRADEPKGRKFHCYFQGGINRQELQNAHTLSLFYLAQSYTKLGLKDKAAQTCGLTLQRQYATGKYQINDFCHNLIGLAEYYEGIRCYGQGLYLLMLALQVLPEGKKKKMRAKVQIALGGFEAHMLDYSVQNIRNKKTLQQISAQNQKANQQLLIFHNFKQNFPKVKLANDLQQCKSLFRKSKTQYDAAIKIFVLDGYVTEHIDILFAIQKLYHNLCKLDKSRQRVCLMLQKRRDMLQPLLKQLNKMAFPATWQKILVECSEIYNDLFQIKTLIATDVKQGKPISEPKLRQCVQIGNKLNAFYGSIIEQLENDKEAEKNTQYYRSLINSKFNIAKTLSKMYSNQIKQRVQYLKQAWYKYKELAEYIKTKIPNQDDFEQELKLTHEMIGMLPNKIDRINYKQVSPFQ